MSPCLPKRNAILQKVDSIRTEPQRFRQMTRVKELNTYIMPGNIGIGLATLTSALTLLNKNNKHCICALTNKKYVCREEGLPRWNPKLEQ